MVFSGGPVVANLLPGTKKRKRQQNSRERERTNEGIKREREREKLQKPPKTLHIKITYMYSDIYPFMVYTAREER